LAKEKKKVEKSEFFVQGSSDRKEIDFISRALDVLSLVEKRFISFAAIEITKKLS